MAVVVAVLVGVLTICQQGTEGILEEQKLNSLCLPWPPFFLDCKDARTTDVCDVNQLPPKCKRQHGAICETDEDCPKYAICYHHPLYIKCMCVPEAPNLYGVCMPENRAGRVRPYGDYDTLGIISMMTSLAMQFLLSRGN